MKEKANNPQPIPPRIEEVRIYFSQKGIPEKEADHFFLLNEKRGWMSKKGRPIKSWRPNAYHWVASVIRDCPWYFDKQTH